MEDSHSHSYSQPQQRQSDAEDGCRVPTAPEHASDGSSEASDAVFSRCAAGSNCGARYKLMSPAKLPIARSSGISAPPGLSPTSFVESPVLLSIKAEPSPTTGSFSNLNLMQGSSGSAFLFPDSTGFSQRKSRNFEFKFPIGSSSTPGLTSIGHMKSAGLNQQRNESQRQLQDHVFSQPSAPLSLVESSIPTSHEFNSAVTLHTLSDGTDAIESSDLNQGEKAVNSDQPFVTAERSSEDEYNWRKYGQKLVKGSEFPRSYYKCTYPNCEVKKIFERSPDGKIKEIIYKGSHDHPKPQPSRRFTPGGLMSIQEDHFEKDYSSNGPEDKFQSNGQTGNMQHGGTPVVSPQKVGDGGNEGATLLLLGANDDMDEDDPYSKRRKMDGGTDITPLVKPIREPRVVVQTVSEVDVLDDGYRWRKYGQKVVRGNPNPRSYYKCTNAECTVRKHVERASHDPKAVITTYEGKHNHDLPIARPNSHEIAGTAHKSVLSRVRPDVNNVISLDLGVGIGYGIENRTVQSQVLASGMISMANGGLNRYESRENHVLASGYETRLPLQSSNQCPPQTLGRILMGP